MHEQFVLDVPFPDTFWAQFKMGLVWSEQFVEKMWIGSWGDARWAGEQKEIPGKTRERVDWRDKVALRHSLWSIKGQQWEENRAD